MEVALKELSLLLSIFSTKVYVVGSNDCGYPRLGYLSLGEAFGVKTLTKMDSLSRNSMVFAVCGERHLIFGDDRGGYWSCGRNDEGQCALGRKASESIKRAEPIRFFKAKGIEIGRVCLNICSWNTFWISEDKQRVYGNGLNTANQIGTGDPSNCHEPVLLHGLSDKNVIDIKSTTSARSFSVALCDPKTGVLVSGYYKEHINEYIPFGLIQCMVLFHGRDCVYVAGKGNEEWTALEFFANTKITKIDCVKGGAMLLESTGVLWEWWGDQDPPEHIEYFTENEIKIVDIACGDRHCLAVDGEGRIYSWGDNHYGQCGHSRADTETEDNRMADMDPEPKLIEALRDCRAERVRCGRYHSYIQTVDGKHFLFGWNCNGECLKTVEHGQERKSDVVYPPFCINPILERYYGINHVHSVSLGTDCTIFMVSGNSNALSMQSQNELNLRSSIEMKGYSYQPETAITA